MRLSKEDIEYLIDMLRSEIEVWKDGCKYVEYEISEKSYEQSKKILDKLKEGNEVEIQIDYQIKLLQEWGKENNIEMFKKENYYGEIYFKKDGEWISVDSETIFSTPYHRLIKLIKSRFCR